MYHHLFASIFIYAVLAVFPVWFVIVVFSAPFIKEEDSEEVFYPILSIAVLVTIFGSTVYVMNDRGTEIELDAYADYENYKRKTMTIYKQAKLDPQNILNAYSKFEADKKITNGELRNAFELYSDAYSLEVDMSNKARKAEEQLKGRQIKENLFGQTTYTQVKKREVVAVKQAIKRQDKIETMRSEKNLFAFKLDEALIKGGKINADPLLLKPNASSLNKE